MNAYFGVTAAPAFLQDCLWVMLMGNFIRDLYFFLNRKTSSAARLAVELHFNISCTINFIICPHAKEDISLSIIYIILPKKSKKGGIFGKKVYFR